MQWSPKPKLKMTFHVVCTPLGQQGALLLLAYPWLDCSSYHYLEHGCWHEDYQKVQGKEVLQIEAPIRKWCILLLCTTVWQTVGSGFTQSPGAQEERAYHMPRRSSTAGDRKGWPQVTSWDLLDEQESALGRIFQKQVTASTRAMNHK